MPATRVAVIQARPGSRTPSGRNDFLRYRQSAIDGPGPATQRPGFFSAKMKATSSSVS